MADEHQYTIGNDIGSSGTKTILKRDDGEIAAIATRSYPGDPSSDGISEQNPETWWGATVEGVKEVMAKSGVAKENVKGIGFSGQMHGLVALDGDNNVVRPSIIWNDSRNGKELETLVEQAEVVKAETGNFPYMRGTGLRILWMHNNERDKYEATRHVLLPKDYIGFRMTGKHVSEWSGFSGTLLLNPQTRKISAKMAELCKVKLDTLPEIIAPHQSRGNLTEAAAEELGLTTDCVVAGGLPDQPAAHLGNGYLDINAQTGTSLVTFAKQGTGKLVTGEGISYVLDAFGEGSYILCSPNGGGVFNWYANQRPDLLAEAERRGVEVYDVMQERAKRIPAGAEGLMFAPYLSGEMSPHQDSNVRGAFLGISGNHKPDHFLRAVYDTLAGYIFMDFQEMLKDKFGIEPLKVSSAGGFMNSSLMKSILTAATGWSVHVPEEGQHAGAYAGAMCADVAAGLQPDLKATVGQVNMTSISAPKVMPSTPAYRAGHQVYQTVYGAISGVSSELVSLAARGKD